MSPKYQQIYQTLIGQIQQQTYKTGELLPSENELMRQFNVSRDTIRKTLSLLQEQGYIQKVMGKGSQVLANQPIALQFSGITSFKEVAKNLVHDQVETDLILFDAANHSEEAQLFIRKIEQENPNSIFNELIKEQKNGRREKYITEQNSIQLPNIFKIERVRNINGEKIIFDTDYLNSEIVPNITREIAQDSLYEYIEEQLGLAIGFTQREITAIPANTKDKQLLDIAEFDFLICVKSFTYLEDASLFQYTISKHRPDKFKFVDFARRNKIKTVK